jgi:metal-responsive CopG/Arc/MetJ family transcriptional regulator
MIFYSENLDAWSVEIDLDNELIEELNAQSKRDFEEKSMYDMLVIEQAFEKELVEYERLHEEMSGQEPSIGM